MPGLWFAARSAVLVMLVVIAAVCSPAVLAGDIYVQAQTGNNSNPGTAALPLQTLSSVDDRAQDGDVIYLSGRFTDSMHLLRPTGITVRQWPGQPQAEVTNSRQVTAWEGAGPIYTSFIGSSLDVSAVSVRWGDPQIKDQYGRDKTFLVPGANQTVPYTWSYNAATGVISINLNGENPNTGRHALFPVEYCLGSPIWIGMNLELANNCIVDGIHFRHSIGSGTGTYGLKVGGTDNIIRHCKSWHLSWHHMTFVGSGNDFCVNNYMHDCECYGFGNTGTANMVTLYSTFEDVRLNRLERLNLHVYQMLRYDTGLPLNPNIAIDGFYSHGGGFGAVVYDNQWTDCVVRHYENPGSPFGLGDGASARIPAPGTPEELDWTQWPNRVVGCTFTGLRAAGYPNETAFSRCVFICPSLGRSAGANAIFNYIGIPGHRSLLLDACYIAADAAGTGSKGFFLIKRTSLDSLRLIAINTTFYQMNPDMTNWLRFFWFEGSVDTGAVRMFGNVFELNHGGTGGTLLYNDGNLSDSRLTFRGNYYHGVSPTYYSGAESRDTQAEWQLIDPVAQGAVYDIEARLLDPLQSAQPLPGSDLAHRRVYQDVHAAIGINGAPYAGLYGAWQDGGPCIADFNGDLAINSQDFFLYINAFFNLDPSANVNHDAYINTQDFFDFLNALFAGC